MISELEVKNHHNETKAWNIQLKVSHLSLYRPIAKLLSQSKVDDFQSVVRVLERDNSSQLSAGSKLILEPGELSQIFHSSYLAFYFRPH